MQEIAWPFSMEGKAMKRIAIIDVAAMPAPYLDGFGGVAPMVTE